MLMKTAVLFILCLALSLASQAQIKKDKESLLESEPGVVYLNQIFDKPVKLNVIEQAQVFSDKDGSHRLGFLKADQVVELEGMTEKAYRVRGQGTKNGIAGWVSPKAFSHSDPEFIGKLKKIYERQIAVNEIIKNKGLAIGMTPKEVELSRGKPTKTTKVRLENLELDAWEYLQYKEIKHYVTRVDPVTGQTFRSLSHITTEEVGKTTVHLKDGAVYGLIETEDKRAGGPRIIIPPVVVGW
jgi:hypothetical protein